MTQPIPGAFTLRSRWSVPDPIPDPDPSEAPFFPSGAVSFPEHHTGDSICNLHHCCTQIASRKMHKACTGRDGVVLIQLLAFLDCPTSAPYLTHVPTEAVRELWEQPP